MIDPLRLAGRYVLFHRGKSATLVVGLALAMLLPLGFRVTAGRFRTELTSRAEAIPWVVGRRGSPVELTLHALYFEPSETPGTTMATLDRLRAGDSGEAIPVHVRFRASDAPLVGTTLDYFPRVGLRIEQGRPFGRLGECVVGAAAARRLKLAVGDRLLTDAENRIDIAGSYPLQLTVAGIAAVADSPDDDAIFVDLKTSWIVAGIGHGHVEVDRNDPEQVLGPTGQGEPVVASPAVTPFVEITDENLSTFHFHGDPSEFPISAVLVWPRDRRAEDLLRGRFVAADEPLQLADSRRAVDRLIATVLRLQTLLDAAGIFLGLVSGSFLALVIGLSYQLRQTERLVLHRLGCARATVLQMQLAEWGLILGAAAGIVGVTMLVLWGTGLSLPRDWLT